MFIKIALLLTLLFSAAAFGAQCLEDEQWKEMSKKEKNRHLKQFDYESVDDGCFYTYIKRLVEVDSEKLGTLDQILVRRTRHEGFSPELFLRFFQIETLVNNTQLWRMVVNTWIQNNQPVYSVLMDYSKGSKMPVADSLYEALHEAGAMDIHAYVRWGKVLSILEKYKEAASVYCLICVREPRMVHLALSQMGQFFSDAEPRKIAPALDSFSRCMSQSSFPDKALYRNYLADLCGKMGLYEKQVEILVELDVPGAPVTEKLLEIAMNHLSDKRYRLAQNAALLAYNRLNKGELRSNAAVIAYQSYLELGVKDSALYWLGRADLSTQERMADAAALCQVTGHLHNARILIDSMSSSLTRDTLLIRQYLFAGEKKKATSFSADSMRHRNSKERNLWKGRAFLFSSQPLKAAAVFDSMAFSSTWHAASEVLNYRFGVKKLQGDAHALKTWAQIEYYIYIGKLQKGADLLFSEGLSNEVTEWLAVRLGRTLLRARRALETIQILDKVNIEKHSPEFLYIKAEALYIEGRLKQASSLVEQLLVDFPTDVFAQKARILLTRIRTAE
ncbi:MAG: hypothetical protein ACLFQB_02260 [Chitinispirillaceae bacterium]